MRHTARHEPRQPQQPLTDNNTTAPTTHSEASAPRVHTPTEAATLLTVPESWLRRQAGQRKLPCTFLGRHLRFSDADLQAIITAGARPARTTSRRPRRD
ncbi:helix-turn-helix domain-containing protein [Solihabitans fulvus]|uniref:helix-turn-helix domain-containing protein n=1 Tax=Solihabitans fulvus TaxID=1892852 RepID=UPI0034D21393